MSPNRLCHPERSEGSDYTDIAAQILRFAQDDKLLFTRSGATKDLITPDVAVQILRFAQDDKVIFMANNFSRRALKMTV
jgi:chaperone required for assembly of F1-ATPase